MHEKEIQELKQQIQELRNDIAPMVEIFKTLKNVGKWLAIAVAFAGSLGAAAIAFKDFFNKK